MPAIMHTGNGYGFSKSDTVWITNKGVPTASTGIGYAGKGSLCTDETNGNLYINGGTKAAPVWKLVTRAA